MNGMISKLVIVAAALALIVVTSDFPNSVKARVNMCDMDSQRIYGLQSKDSAIYLDSLSFIVTCMRAHNYDIDFGCPGCDGKEPPAPQLRPTCYRYSWASAFGFAESN
jgi:hypothetical protein